MLTNFGYIVYSRCTWMLTPPLSSSRMHDGFYTWKSIMNMLEVSWDKFIMHAIFFFFLIWIIMYVITFHQNLNHYFLNNSYQHWRILIPHCIVVASIPFCTYIAPTPSCKRWWQFLFLSFAFLGTGLGDKIEIFLIQNLTHIYWIILKYHINYN